MTVYTRPNRSDQPNFNLLPAPGLYFQKWQAWDSFDSFKREKSRPEYFSEVARIVEAVYHHPTYRQWHERYFRALQTLGVESVPYTTVWRLLVGWGSNPTMEAGLILHHLYGFPYIPGSALKGLLHHLAEMEVMDILQPADLEPSNLLQARPPDSLLKAIPALQVVKVLFGSIHLEPAVVKENGREKPIDPKCPRPLLQKLGDKLKKNSSLSNEWKDVEKKIAQLLEEQTGGMLCFYDAVPEVPESEHVPESIQEWLLQTDIVNCHYDKYYGSKGEQPPSDDQSPNPVTFLAVQPGVQFNFPFRLADWPVAPGRDDEEKERLQALHHFTRESVTDQVKSWLQKALGEFGVGAKTAAGYGYFDTGAIAPPAATPRDDTTPPTPPEVAIIPVAPSPFKSNITPAAKISGIGKNHQPNLWQQLAANDYIQKIAGKSPSLKSFGLPLPARRISPNGKTMQVFYQNEKFYCEVELKLQEIKNQAEAQHLWEKVILPELKKG